MQTARNYAVTAAVHMEHALGRMPLVAVSARKLPVTRQEIACYVEQLLTPEEQRICDMATD